MDNRGAPTFRRSATWIEAWIVAVSLWLFTAPAAAEVQSLAILGLAAEGTDDSLAVGLTDALRADAESRGVYRLAATRASLSQMTTVQDCEITESSCRAAVGTALGVEAVLYGSITAAGEKGYHVELHLFTTDGAQKAQAERDIPHADADTADLAPHAHALLSALRGEDDAPAVVAPVAVAPVPGTQAEPVDDLSTSEPASSHSSNDWIGYTLLGVGAVTTGLTVLSWVQISAAQDDPDYNIYRAAVGEQMPRADDVCQEAYNGKRYGTTVNNVVATRDACDKGQTYQRLQYVFLAAALVSLGIGTYFLLDEEPNDGQAGTRGRRLALLPSVGRDGASLAMHLDF